MHLNYDYCCSGYFEANAESVASYAAASCVEIIEEPGAVLRPKVATMYVLLLLREHCRLTVLLSEHEGHYIDLSQLSTRPP